MDRLTDLLEQGVRKGDFPGAAYAVVHSDGTIDADAVGYRQTEPEKIPVDGDEIYDCASLTKVIATTTMIMRLIETDRLSLKQAICDLLPRFRHPGIRIEHLLTHTSGLPADIPHAKDLSGRADVEKHLYAMDPAHSPGERVVYSDVGYILLGWVIETLTGGSLADFARTNVFEPLNMHDTSYHPDASRAAPTEYRDDDVHKGLLRGKVHDEKAFALGGEAGHAGMFSTVGDLSKFMISLLNNDGTILKRETVDMLFPVRIDDMGKDGVRRIRAYGWQKPTPGGTAGDLVDFQSTIIHTGFTGCNLWMDRAKGIGFVLLSNAVHPKRSCNNIGPYRRRLADLILSEKENE